LISHEGWIQGDGYLERPPVDLWRALETLEGRWLSPDLVTAMVAPVPEHLQPDPDPVDFASRPRWFAHAPSPTDVADAIRAELVPLELHTLRWRPALPDGPEELKDLPRWYLSQAEATLPNTLASTVESPFS
jgi:hypothetical protein